MVREASRLTEARVPEMASPAVRRTLQHLLAESFVSSYRVVMLVAAALALAAAVCAALTIDSGRRAARKP